MSSRLIPSWRILPFLGVAGFVIVAGQSCDDRSKHDAAPITALPSDPEVGPTVTGDPPITTNDKNVAITKEPVACAAGGSECPDGLICCPKCCTKNMGKACIKATDGKCPLPDLQVNAAALATSPYIETINATECEVSEGCVGGPGARKVLRFDTNVPNAGLADLQFGNPDAGGADGPFAWAPCHKHYHFKNFAHYGLVDPADGKTVVAGRKQAFCAMDSARVDRAAIQVGKYDCGNQGISTGWEDIYPAGLPCQYVDITDIPAGKYRLQVEVNPEHAITETDYDNNKAAVEVDIP